MGKKREDESSGAKGLKKNLGTASVFAICTGAAFSSGFFLLPGFAADVTGPSLPLVFLLAGVLMLPAIFSISELSSAMPRSGGPYFFITRSFGPLTGIIGALGIYLQWLLKGAFAFVGVGYYISILVEIPVEPLACGLIVFFTVVNLFGSKQSSVVEIFLVVVLIIVLSLFVFAGIKEIMPQTDKVAERFQPLIPFGIEGFLAAIALVFVSFGGMGQVASVAGEIKKPSKAIPRGMLFSLAVVSFFYLAGTAIIIALLDQDVLHDNPTPVAEAAGQFRNFPIPVIIIVVAALAAFTSTGNAVILSAARYPLALSRDKLLWRKFSKVSKKGIPITSVITTGIILVMLVLLFDVESIAKLASGFLLFTFVGLCLSVIIFRESQTGEYKPGYKTPFYPWMQIAGIAVYLVLIFFSGVDVLIFIAGISLFGFLWFYGGLKEKQKFPAAIYQLFGRIARSGDERFAFRQSDLTLQQGEHLTSVVERAIFINLEDDSSFDDVMVQASQALTERLGGEREGLREKLKQEVKHMLHPVEFNISVAPALLEGIEQPEMIIIKGRIGINNETSDGVIILADDIKASERLFRLTSQLDAVIHRDFFPDAWKKAGSVKEIKEALTHDVRTLTIRIEKSDPADYFVGKKVGEIELPEGSLIILLNRKGKLFVPDGDSSFEPGDEITIVAEKKSFDELVSRFRRQ